MTNTTTTFDITRRDTRREKSAEFWRPVKVGGGWLLLRIEISARVISRSDNSGRVFLLSVLLWGIVQL